MKKLSRDSSNMKSFFQTLRADRVFAQCAIKPSKRRRRKYLSVGFIAVPILLSFSGIKLLGDDRVESKRTARRIRTIVDRFRQDRSIRERVHISIIARNEKLVSVEQAKERRGGFYCLSTKTFSAL